jgi:acyl-CoA hydrolase
MLGSTGCRHAGLASPSQSLHKAVRDSELMCVSQGAAYPACSLTALSAMGLLTDIGLLVGQIPEGAFLPMNVPVKTFFPSGPLGTSAALARTKSGYWRASLYQVASSMSTGAISPDVAIIKVSPPRDGYRSVAFHADYAIPLFEASRSVILEECSRAPWLGTHIPASAPHIVDVIIGCEETPPIHSDEAQLESALWDIGRNVAKLVPENAILQLGMGKWARAVAAEMGKRGIAHFHTGLVDRWLVDLIDALGDDLNVDITTSAIADDGVTAAAAERLYRSGRLQLQPATTTHNPGTLAALRPFVAINSALEIDLLGRANCECVVRGGESLRRGIGGLWDFASAAAAQGDGLSIIALRTQSNGRPRIVPRLDSNHVSLPSNMIDVVVTEFGIADLRGLSVDERIEEILNVAAARDRAWLVHEAASLDLHEAALPDPRVAWPYRVLDPAEWGVARSAKSANQPRPEPT